MKKLLVFIALAAIGLSGCTDAGRSKIIGYGSTFHIKQFSGGQVVGEWDSTGKVQSEAHSDGYYFEDAKTKKVVEVNGILQITQK